MPKVDDTFRPPPDTHTEDAALPRGTVLVELRDADDKPIPNEIVLLAEISEKPVPNVVAFTDNRGQAILSAPSWSGLARVVTHKTGDGEFWTAPFPMGGRGGTRVILHSYASSKDIAELLVAFQCAVLVEVVGTDLKVTQSLNAFNFSPKAWLADIPFALPKKFSGFDKIVFSETSVNITAEGGRALITGTLAPGKHEIEMSWRTPLATPVRIAMPPHVAVVRILADPATTTRLEVAGFPAAKITTSSDGTRMLVTERQLKRDDPPLQAIDVNVR